MQQNSRWIHNQTNDGANILCPAFHPTSFSEEGPLDPELEGIGQEVPEQGQPTLPFQNTTTLSGVAEVGKVQYIAALTGREGPNPFTIGDNTQMAPAWVGFCQVQGGVMVCDLHVPATGASSVGRAMQGAVHGSVLALVPAPALCYHWPKILDTALCTPAVPSHLSSHVGPGWFLWRPLDCGAMSA